MSDVTQDIDLVTRSDMATMKRTGAWGLSGRIAEFAREPDEAVVVSRSDASIAVGDCSRRHSHRMAKGYAIVCVGDHDAR